MIKMGNLLTHLNADANDDEDYYILRIQERKKEDPEPEFLRNLSEGYMELYATIRIPINFSRIHQELLNIKNDKPLRIYFENATFECLEYFEETINTLKQRTKKVSAYVEESLNPLLSLLVLACDEIHMKNGTKLSNLHIDTYMKSDYNYSTTILKNASFEKLWESDLHDQHKVINYFINFNNSIRQFIRTNLNSKLPNDLKDQIIETMFNTQIESTATALINNKPYPQIKSSFSIDELRKIGIIVKSYN